jgi:hypothetical protein
MYHACWGSLQFEFSWIGLNWQFVVGVLEPLLQESERLPQNFSPSQSLPSSSPDYKHVQRVCKHLDAVLCSLSPLLVSGYALFAIRFLVWVCGKEDTTTSKRGRPTPRAVNKGEGSKREHSSRQAHKMWVSSHDLVHIPG